MRVRRGYSLRALADRSGLNINTLSLIENGKSSPSVSTLQQLAQALEVPISAFFESEPVKKQIVHTPVSQRPLVVFGRTQMQNLAQDLASGAVQPFVVTLQPGAGSGDRMVVHTGEEFVYCLSGSVQYRIDQEDYLLRTGDSLTFTAHLPHCWENQGDDTAQLLLVFCPSDQCEQPGERHFSAKVMRKENILKIAVISDDGITISRHFGRARSYVVLTIQEGKVVGREMRSKLGHEHFHTQEHGLPGQAEEAHEAGHGMDAASHDRHASMAEAISDCQAILCGGMGMGAYESMRRLNIQPVVTDLTEVDAAVQAFIDGKLVDHVERLH